MRANMDVSTADQKGILSLVEFLSRYPNIRLAHPNDFAAVNGIFQDPQTANRKLELCRWHSERFYIFAMSNRENRVQGTGTLVIRPGYIDGRIEDVGCFSNIQVRMNRETSYQWRRFLSDLLESAPNIRELKDVRLFYTSLFDDGNRDILNMLKKPRADFHFKRVCEYQLIYVCESRSFWARAGSNSRVATSNDMEALTRFLTRSSMQQRAGYVPAFELPRRFKTWPGFQIERFILFEQNGEILGATALWGSESLHRIRLTKDEASANRFSIHRFLKGSQDTPIDAEKPVQHLTHFSVAKNLSVNRRREIARELFLRAWQISRKENAVLAYCDFPRESFKSQLDGFVVRDTPMAVFEILSKKPKDDEPETFGTYGLEPVLLRSEP